MTLFNISKRKLVVISSIVLVLVIGTIYTVKLDDKFSLREASDLHIRKTFETISYWFSYKVRDNPFALLANAFTSNNYTQTFKKGSAKSIPVLTYHGIPNEGVGHVPKETFVEQMKAIHDAGWQTVTMDQFYRFMGGEIDLPERSFLLTFDDGRKDTFYPADPVLKDLDYTAVMFAISKKSTIHNTENSTYYISEYELAQMEKSGRWDVESHGRDSHDWYYLDGQGTEGHFFSNKLWLNTEERMETDEEFRERIVYDLTNSKKDLETALNKEVRFFAFPFGDFGHDSINYSESYNILKEEVAKIYKLAFYQVWHTTGETFNYPTQDTFMIKRIEPERDWTGDFLKNKLESGITKELPYEETYFGESWVQNWGKSIKGDTLLLEAEEETTGASTSLNGSWLWSDYLFTTDVDWQGGSNIVLTARKEDSNNYYGCNFGKNKVYIKSSTAEYSSNIESADYNLASLGNNLNLGIKVEGSNISCMVNGVTVLNGPSINYSIPNGGIGIEIWDEDIGEAVVSFDNVSVIPL